MGDKNDLLVDLQTRLAFQDQAIAELSDVIADQQRQLDQMRQRLKLLGDKLDALEGTLPQGSAPDQEIPPHY